MRGGGQSRFVRDVARVFGGQVVMTVIGVGTGIITARMLGPHGRGILQLVVQLPVMIGNFAKLGIPQASVFFMRRRNVEPTRIISNDLCFALVFGSTAVFVCYLARDWFLAHLLKDAPAPVFTAVLLLVPVVIFQAYLMGVVQGLQQFREYNFQQIMPNLLAFVGMFVVLVLLRRGVVGAVFTHTAIVVVVCVWLATRVHRLAPIRARFDAVLARGMLAFGGKSYVQTLLATSNFRLGQFLIAYFLTPTEVGYYAIAVNLTNLLLRIPDALGTVLFPRLAAVDLATAHEATARVCRHTFLLVGLGVVGYATLGPIVIRLLFGDEYRPSIEPMLVLLPAVVAMSLYLILTRNFTSRNRQEVNIVAALTALLSNVGLCVVLVPRWGIVGAAAASCIGYGLAAALLLVMFVLESGTPVRRVLLVDRADLRDLLERGRRLLRR